jgi:hypothetical protein
MFLFQHPEDYLRSLEVDGERRERHHRLLREVRAASSPSGQHMTRRPASAPAMASFTGPERRSVPCPDMKEAMTP